MADSPLAATAATASFFTLQVIQGRPQKSCRSIGVGENAGDTVIVLVVDTIRRV